MPDPKPLDDRPATKPPTSGAVPVAIEDGDRLRVLDHVDAGMAVVQADLFVYANGPLLRMLGHPTLTAMASHRVSAVVGAPSFESWLDGHASNEPQTESWRRADGSAICVDVSLGAMKLGDADARVVLVRDVTAARRAQAQLEQAERLAAVGTLAAGVAHQLNNPLAYVIANVNYLTEELPAFLRAAAPALAPEQQTQVDEMLGAMSDAREGAERVARIVRDLRTFSRMEDERRDVLDVVTLLESACVLVESELKNRGRLVKSLDPVPPVEANPSRLAQAFLNLLLNAAQAIPEGAPSRNEVSVRAYADEDDGMIVVEVRDTGVGMSPAVQARIFDPFFTLKPVGEGTGLGLTTCLALVHAMGGSITVDSEEGLGSTFRVRLPPATRSTKRAHVSSAPEVATRRRVLVVDDELTLLSSLRRALGRELDTVLATSAAEALGILEKDRRFDVVLCDIMMPDVTGIELFERVSEKYPELRERFVFMTGGAYSATTRHFVESTELPRLEKPFDVRELRRLLRGRAKAPPR